MPKKWFFDEKNAFALMRAQAGTWVGEIYRGTGFVEITRRHQAAPLPQTSPPRRGMSTGLAFFRLAWVLPTSSMP